MADLEASNCISHAFCFSDVGVVQCINFFDNLGYLVSIQVGKWVLL